MVSETISSPPTCGAVGNVIYLDCAATTPIDPRVAAAMAAHLGPEVGFANPASLHAAGRREALAVERARRQVAEAVGADPREIVWTSGATEADNLALQGAAVGYRRRGRHLVTVKTEHKAVLDTCAHLERQGFAVTYLDCGRDGLLDPDHLADALRDDTVLVSVMHVNNETGVIQDIDALGERVKAKGALFHVDAAQSGGKWPLDLAHSPVDLMSFSAHKCYGPKGVGALYVRRRPKVRLEALLHGGGQERGLRAGTIATHQVVGMGEAFALAYAQRAADQRHLTHLGQPLLAGLLALGEVVINGHPTRRYPGILNLSFLGVDVEALLAATTPLAASAGSACTSAQAEPSHVLAAMGLPLGRSSTALRLSPGRFTTAADIDRAVALIAAAVLRLRELSPWWEGYREGTLPADVAWS